MTKLILSAFADEYCDDFSSQLEALKKHSISYTELRFVDGKNVSALTKTEISEVKSKLGKSGIKLSAIASPLGKIQLDGDLDAHIETAKKIYSLAEELGAKNVRMFSFYPPKNQKIEACRGEVFDAVGRLLKASDGFEVTLCHENEAEIYGESPTSCLELLKYFNKKLKCVFDMGNFVLSGYDPMDAYNLLFEHIEYFHIKDALYEGAVVPAGKGEAKIADILNSYRTQSKSSAFITLEPHLQTFSGLNALAKSKFDNPYKYENQQLAFDDAVIKLKGIL